MFPRRHAPRLSHGETPLRGLRPWLRHLCDLSYWESPAHHRLSGGNLNLLTNGEPALQESAGGGNQR